MIGFDEVATIVQVDGRRIDTRFRDGLAGSASRHLDQGFLSVGDTSVCDSRCGIGIRRRRCPNLPGCVRRSTSCNRALCRVERIFAPFVMCSVSSLVRIRSVVSSAYASCRVSTVRVVTDFTLRHRIPLSVRKEQSRLPQSTRSLSWFPADGSHHRQAI